MLSRFKFLAMVSITLLGLISASNAYCNDINECPILDYKFYLRQVSEHQKIVPTLRQFFLVLDKKMQPNDVKFSWREPKNNFFIIDVNIIDIATGKIENFKMGIQRQSDDICLLTDLWNKNGVHTQALYGASALSPFYDEAIESVK